MYCDVCGNKNVDGSIFCEECGNKILESEENLGCNEAIEQLKYEGYEVFEGKDNRNSKKIKEHTERKYSKVQKQKNTEGKPSSGKSLKNDQVKVNNTPQSSNAIPDRNAFLKELKKAPKEIKFDNPRKKRNKSKLILIGVEIIVVIAIIIIGYLLYNI